MSLEILAERIVKISPQEKRLRRLGEKNLLTLKFSVGCKTLSSVVPWTIKQGVAADRIRVPRLRIGPLLRRIDEFRLNFFQQVFSRDREFE